MSYPATFTPATLTFGVLLKSLRKAAGMTQRDLAAALGYSDSQISGLEKDQRPPDLDAVMQRFAPALGLQDDPATIARLVEQAAAARGERPLAVIAFQRTTQVVVQAAPEEHAKAIPPPTALIGRATAVNQLCNRLLGHSGRLLTLIGPPGIGKTTLALAVAARLQLHYRDGAIFVPLAAISDPTLMAATIAVAVGSSDLKRLIEFLRRKTMLLVLDNLEQLLPHRSAELASKPSPPQIREGATRENTSVGLIAELIAECPGLCILATSRERLHLRAEQRYKVPPLDLAPAVELFTQRAQAVDADFSHTPRDQPTLEAICQRLDCLPLAIELCAAQIDILPPAQLLAQLQDHRLDLLVDGAHDLPPRQRTLRSAIGYSYALLNETERLLLRSLAVFAGGFDFEAVEAIVADGLEPAAVHATLHALISKSLVRAETLPSGAQRFLLLETIREFALEMLLASDEQPVIQQRHVHYFLAMAQNADLHLGDGEEKICFDQLEREHDNLRAALRWSLTTNPVIALSLTSVLFEFWCERGYYTEGRNWLAQALWQKTASPSQARGKALRGAGRLALNQGDYGQATTLFEESLHLYYQLSDQQGIANALNSLGTVALYQHDLSRANEFLSQSLTLRGTIDHQADIADSLNLLGLVAVYQGDFYQARIRFEEKLIIERANNNKSGIELTHCNLGYCELHQGRSDAATVHFITGIKMALHLGDREALAFYLEGLAEIAGLYKEEQEFRRIATILFGAADALRKTLGAPLPPMDQILYGRTVSLIRTYLDDAAFAAAWATGQAMMLEESVAFAIGTLSGE